MYDPKFTQKQMYDQYGSSRETTKNVTKSTRSSGYSGNNPNEDAAVTRGIGAKPPSFGGGQDNNPNRDEYENKPTIAKVYEKTVDLFKSFGAKEPEALIVDGKRVYQGPLFSGYDPTVRIGPFGGDAGKKQYRFGMPFLGEVSPSYPSPTLPSGDNNPALNMFGVRRGFTRGTDMPDLSVSPEAPANMDPLTRGLSQGILPIPDEPTAPYTIRSGDTLSDIAKMTGTTVEELADINNIEKVDEIDAGVVIDIPIRRKPSGLGSNPNSTEFMDAATKEMIENMTPVNASYTVGEAVGSALRPLVRPDVILNKGIQKDLFELGYVQVGGIDGIVGYNTRQALKAFQKENGLPVTGNADEETIKKLNSIDIKNESLDKKMERQIRHHEGTVPYPYKDSLGLWTIGNGHLIGDGSDSDLEKSGYKKYTKKNPMPSSELTKTFKKDLNKHKDIAESYSFYNDMSEEGKRAILDLTFNMGDFLNKKKTNGEYVWKNLRAQLEAGNYEGAADNLASSLYARQVGNRAVTVTNLLRQAEPKPNTSLKPKIKPLGIDT